jgi:NTP pyrophosphatase (non-canonical NTP hydrolase)
MKWNEYLPLAEKTLSTQFNCTEESNQKLLHSCIGSLTEIQEILENYENGLLITDSNKQGSVAEESADIFWYLSILFRELNIQIIEKEEHSFILDKFNVTRPFDLLLEFIKENLKLLDILKKKIYYNKDMNIEVVKKLSINMFYLLNYYCEKNNTNVSDILDKNIAKLKSRYGDKFSSERAINRDLETERTILEKGTN